MIIALSLILSLVLNSNAYVYSLSENYTISTTASTN